MQWNSWRSAGMLSVKDGWICAINYVWTKVTSVGWSCRAEFLSMQTLSWIIRKGDWNKVHHISHSWEIGGVPVFCSSSQPAMVRQNGLANGVRAVTAGRVSVISDSRSRFNTTFIFKHLNWPSNMFRCWGLQRSTGWSPKNWFLSMGHDFLKQIVGCILSIFDLLPMFLTDQKSRPKRSGEFHVTTYLLMHSW